ncbi:MAG TPA: cytochrome c, partial [Rhizomicrobium sp.]|nr:cytochrome c [Rhizomicrobium sp.]
MTMQDSPRPPRSSLRTAVVLILVALVVLAAGFYFAILPGLSVARNEPSKLEVAVATYLLDHSVPASAKAMTNPLGAHPDPAAIRAGHDLFTQKCETCHAYDGGGRTDIGGNIFPRAPVLRTAVASMSDGEIFYHIRNGIRNTAMPAWNFPDDRVWQLVAYIRNLPAV